MGSWLTSWGWLLSDRLLEVFKRLRAIAQAPSDVALQDELLEEAKSIVQDITVDHVGAADIFIKDAELNATIKDEVRKECQLLTEYLEVARRFNLEINSRAKDRVVSYGEKLSCRFMACLLKDKVRVGLARWFAWLCR